MPEIYNDFLIRMDSEAMLMLMGTNKKLSDIRYLEFRKYMFKKYYKDEDETSSNIEDVK